MWGLKKCDWGPNVTYAYNTIFRQLIGIKNILSSSSSSSSSSLPSPVSMTLLSARCKSSSSFACALIRSIQVRSSAVAEIPHASTACHYCCCCCCCKSVFAGSPSFLSLCICFLSSFLFFHEQLLFF